MAPAGFFLRGILPLLADAPPSMAIAGCFLGGILPRWPWQNRGLAEFLEISQILEPACRSLCRSQVLSTEYGHLDVTESGHDPS